MSAKPEDMGMQGEGAGTGSKIAAGVQQAATAVKDAVSCGTTAAGSSQDPRAAGKQQPFPHQEQQHPGQEHQTSPKPDYGCDGEFAYKGHDKLKDKVALITGADSGIGRAVALAFAREGADVAISYLNEHEDAKETQRVCEEAGRQTLLIPGDLSTEAGCKNAVAQTVDKFGRIDILVNNAAFQGAAVDDFRELSRERLECTFNTNIIAYFQMAQFALDHMKKGSCIINTTSVQAYQPLPMVSSVERGSCDAVPDYTVFAAISAIELIKRMTESNSRLHNTLWKCDFPFEIQFQLKIDASCF